MSITALIGTGYNQPRAHVSLSCAYTDQTGKVYSYHNTGFPLSDDSVENVRIELEAGMTKTLQNYNIVPGSAKFEYSAGL